MQEPTGDTEKLIAERHKTHGDYDMDASTALAIKEVLERSFKPIHAASMRHAMIMIAFKLARILIGDPDFADHWRDIAGYATLVAERCSK